MKIDRLIGILTVLLQQGKVTAPHLAKKFEVSRRTISRDIETLCLAGIPITTEQGANGGISIMEGYRMDHTLLTRPELQAILTGLRGLDSVSGSNRYRQLMDKLSGPAATLSVDYIRIDLSSYYKSSLAPKIELLQTAAGACRLVEFDYLGPNRESHRRAEPGLLVFQWSSWYLWAFCLDRQSFRLFKLNRMLHLHMLADQFSPRPLPPCCPKAEEAFPHRFEAVVRFHASMKWRLVDEYGPDCFQKLPDGRLLFRFGFTDRGQLFRWILSFGDTAELLEPDALRAELRLLLQNILKSYGGT